jgi:hypothetical protein
MCWKCGIPLTVNPPVSRSEVCAKCGADVRCCKNCMFYSPGAHYDCRETVEELVADKERANFCESWRSVDRAQFAVANCGVSDKVAKAKSDFDSLFA